MTSFFEQQDRARRNTRYLLVLLGLAVLGIALALYVLFQMLGLGVDTYRGQLARAPAPGFDLHTFFITFLATLGFVSVMSLGRMASLRGGGAKIAEALGGRLVSTNPKDALEKRLLNVVEEMAIASGVPVPQVFVLDGETGINAFAAGHSLDDAAIGITRGALEKLTRSELQGVIAHEFSHVLNGDMRLNMRLLGILFGILCIGLAGRFLLRVTSRTRISSSRRRGGGGDPTIAIFFLGLALFVIGTLGELFGRLIKAAVSRQREYLADASAVQFTRDPQSIAGALKKIGGYSAGAVVSGARAEEASHFFFGDIHKRLFGGEWLSTHPKLVDRIKRVDPSFQGEFPKVAAGVLDPPPELQPGAAGVAAGFAAAPEPSRPSALSALEPTRPSHEPLPGITLSAGAQPQGVEGRSERPREHVVSPAAVMDSIGTVNPEAIDQGRTLLAELPPAMRQAAHDSFSACALVYALLLSNDEAVRKAQCQELERRAGERLLSETQRWHGPVRALARRARLPLVELLAPSLRELSREQRASFTQTVDALIAADGNVSIFEYVLGDTLRARLLAEDEGRPRPRHRSLKAARAELELLLSLLAHAGDFDGQSAQPALSAAAARLPDVPLSLLPASGRLLRGLGPALRELAALPPALAEQVVCACAHAVLADRRVSDDEETLLRAVCGALGCPLPPLAH